MCNSGGVDGDSCNAEGNSDSGDNDGSGGNRVAVARGLL